ncbi:unnamed protein product [Prorocentrum cordatum]|uniref:tRNA wybutosine-synthesis domain-containing protein n=1 Tax=Prorocentrum cordatum TaxID=2364126 RepID=A0ABN9UIM4_9DINO|nr:unnamed protein product [Polarella glacialis]
MELGSQEGYAELIGLSDCDFVEVKGATWSEQMGKAGLSFSEAIPAHEDVREFADRLASALPGYGVACEHAHSCAVLLARRDRFFEPTGRWRTWIDFDRFADAAVAGRTLEVLDFTVETPEWALADSEAGGFDPAERRVFRKRPA